MPKEKRSRKEQKHKISLSRKLMRMISLTLTFVTVAIIFVTYEGLDIIYLGYAAVNSFFGEREIEEIYRENDENFHLLLDNIEREYEVTVEIYTNDGRFVYSSSYRGDMSSPPYDQYSIELPETEKKNYEEVQSLGTMQNNSFSLTRDTVNGRNSEYLVGEWITDMGVTIKIFKLKSVVDTTTKIAVGFIAVVTITVLLVALIITTVFVRRVTKPLVSMSEITHNLSSLDFSRKCSPNNVAEISLLANSINEMSDSLENALVDLKQKNKKLQDDIEQEKTIDQLRQVFISGVSHELKTPIAIIQGYSEGLKVFMETDPETAAKYCDTIISETERMNNLVMKLLDIIKYESGEYKLLYADFNLHGMIGDWFDRNAEILGDNGITYINNVSDDFTAFGDSFILSTVINNYLTNAVSHVGGEMVIKVDAREINPGVYRVSVFNSGSPIAAKDIDRIWDSFYRADKAMSRSQGHFGLGLAIVAAIQKLHDQDYGVVNHDDGVEFWFDVKKFNG